MKSNVETLEKELQSRITVALLPLIFLKLSNEQTEAILEIVQEVVEIAFQTGSRLTMHEIGKEVFGVDLDKIDLDEKDIEEILELSKTETGEMN